MATKIIIGAGLVLFFLALLHASNLNHHKGIAPTVELLNGSGSRILAKVTGQNRSYAVFFN